MTPDAVAGNPRQHKKQMSKQLFYTTNIKVATALVTLGFEKTSISKTRRADGKESIVFWFEPENADGMDAAAVMDGMTKGGRKLSKDDPENPINYMREFAFNRDELISDIKNTPRMIVMKIGGHDVMISENASPETRAKMAEMIQTL